MSAVVEEIMIPFHQTDRFTLYEGDCRIVLPDLSDCSVDSVVCDPPYELGFMGKGWDRSGIAYDVSVWRECLRVLKPGGHLLAFGGSRTYHRLACAIEDAGFEIRDTITWLFGQGFPKSLRVDKDERFCHCDASGHTSSDTSLAQGRVDHRRTGALLGEAAGEAQNVRYAIREAQDYQDRYHDEHDSRDALPLPVEADGQASFPSQQYAQAHSRSAALVDDQAYEPSHSLFQAQYSDRPSSQDSDSRAWFDANEHDDIQASTAESVNNPTQTDSAVSAYHKRRTALQSSAFPFHCTACGKPDAKGFGTALKPAAEYITVARKPLEGTVAANLLKYGTGGINIDGCRIGARSERPLNRNASIGYGGSEAQGAVTDGGLGRWPSNIIHDGSDEVLAGFPESVDGVAVNRNRQPEIPNQVYGQGWKHSGKDEGYNGSGSASRFFYRAKSSQEDRNEGLESIGESIRSMASMTTRAEREGREHRTQASSRNHHPTVKPTELMRYLCRLVTPPGGIVLDPFCGSGSTGKGAMLEGLRFIGVELSAEYCMLAQRRIEAVTKQGLLFA